MLRQVLVAATGLLVAAAPSSDSFNAEDVLAKSRAAYAALTSYADSGTVEDESSGFTNRSTFRVLFSRKPHQLLIEYRAVESLYKNGYRLPLGKHVVLWLEDGDLQTWYSRTQEHETYPADGGHQVNALKGAAYQTMGISVLMPSHLYTKAGMVSPVHATEEAESDGFETVNGRRCYRILGVERWRYPNGRETGVRAITLWVDAETYLIHKIVQDTPRSMARNAINRRITTIRHRANPQLEPEQFRFAVPAS
jgi:outer membrane lipoprotein-sorting protein